MLVKLVLYDGGLMLMRIFVVTGHSSTVVGACDLQVIRLRSCYKFTSTSQLILVLRLLCKMIENLGGIHTTV